MQDSGGAFVLKFVYLQTTLFAAFSAAAYKQ